jgi:hypothetical protein
MDSTNCKGEVDRVGHLSTELFWMKTESAVISQRFLDNGLSEGKTTYRELHQVFGCEIQNSRLINCACCFAFVDMKQVSVRYYSFLGSILICEVVAIDAIVGEAATANSHCACESGGPAELAAILRDSLICQTGNVNSHRSHDSTRREVATNHVNVSRDLDRNRDFCVQASPNLRSLPAYRDLAEQ